MSLSASDVSDAVLEGLQTLTGYPTEREALDTLNNWRLPLTDSQARRLLAFAISVAETEVARLDDEEETVRVPGIDYDTGDPDEDIGTPIPLDDDAELSEWRHQEDPF